MESRTKRVAVMTKRALAIPLRFIAGIWHGSITWVWFSVLFVGGLAMASLGEFGGGLAVVWLSLISLGSKYWHWCKGRIFFNETRLVVFPVIGLAAILLYYMADDMRGKAPWSHFPNAWNAMLVSVRLRTLELPPHAWPAPAIPSVDQPVITGNPKGDHSPLKITATLKNPEDLVIFASNKSSRVADGVKWELMTFRTSDYSVFSYATQDLGYVKPHSDSANYEMDLSTLPKGPHDGAELSRGDTLVGSLSIDCPECEGTTYIVHIKYGFNGWYCEYPQGKGRLLGLKKGTTPDVYTEALEAQCRENNGVQIVRQP